MAYKNNIHSQTDGTLSISILPSPWNSGHVKCDDDGLQIKYTQLSYNRQSFIEKFDHGHDKITRFIILIYTTRYERYMSSCAFFVRFDSQFWLLLSTKAWNLYVCYVTFVFCFCDSIFASASVSFERFDVFVAMDDCSYFMRTLIYHISTTQPLNSLYSWSVLPRSRRFAIQFIFLHRCMEFVEVKWRHTQNEDSYKTFIQLNLPLKIFLIGFKHIKIQLFPSTLNRKECEF